MTLVGGKGLRRSARLKVDPGKQADQGQRAGGPGFLSDAAQLMINRRKRPAAYARNFLGNGADRAQDIGHSLLETILRAGVVGHATCGPVGPNQTTAAIFSQKRPTCL